MPIKTPTRSLSAVLTGSSLLLALSLMLGVANATVGAVSTQIPLLPPPSSPSIVPTPIATPTLPPPVTLPNTPQTPIFGDPGNNVFVAPVPNDPGGLQIGGKWTPTPNLNLDGSVQVVGGNYYFYSLDYKDPDIGYGVFLGGDQGTSLIIGGTYDWGHGGITVGVGNGGGALIGNFGTPDDLFNAGVNVNPQPNVDWKIGVGYTHLF